MDGDGGSAGDGDCDKTFDEGLVIMVWLTVLDTQHRTNLSYLAR